jgi:tetratricopeptide (TPR) repeat protein
MAARAPSSPRPASQSPPALARAAPRSSAPRWLPPLLVGALAFAVYANSLRNGFVWDDPIILSRQLVVFRTVGDVLAPPRDIPQFSPDYYRPLTIGSYLLDRAVGGAEPFAYHLSVVLAHAAAAVLVYALARQLLAARPAASVGAFAAGALFAVHPIHTESVAWAAGRSDVLATAFLIAALLLHARGGSWLASIGAGMCALAALGAKETAIALYPLMLLLDALRPAEAGRSRTVRLRAYAGPAAAAIVYVALRHHALGEAVGSAPDALPAGQRSLADLVGAVGVYVGKLIWPVGLNAYIDHIDTGLVPMALAVVLMGGAGIACARWRHGRDDEVPLFAMSWLVLTLVPSLAIVWKIPDAPLAERYLYLPSVGLCLLIGALLARGWARTSSRPARIAIAGGGAILLTAAAIGTIRRNPVWHDDVALWEDTEAKSQVSGMAARGLGTAYQQTGRPAAARSAFERALQRRNTPRGLQTIYNNLGTLAMYDGDYAEAERQYRAALAATPNAPDTLFNLGLAILQRGHLSPEAARAALPYYEQARRANPHDSDVEAAIAQAYEVLGDGAAAAEHARAALALGASGATAASLRAMLGTEKKRDQ